jgi:hypothetical protein
MKMKKEAAAKMKKESAMKKAHADKESMAKLMDKASAMKMKDKSPMKADIPEVTITEKKPESKSLMYDVPVIGGKRYKKVKGGFVSASGRKEFIPESNIEKYGGLKYKAIMPDGTLSTIGTSTPGRFTRVDNKLKMVTDREGGTATKMKKESSMKMGHKSAAKQKMNMVKGPDGKMVPDFAVDGKGVNDMKSATKLKKFEQAEGPARGKTKKEMRQDRREDRKMARKLKRGLKARGKEMEDKTPGTGLKKKDSAVKMVKRVDPKVSKLKEMKTQQIKPLPNKGRVTPKPTKQIKVANMKPMKPMKPVKMPKVTARF